MKLYIICYYTTDGYMVLDSIYKSKVLAEEALLRPRFKHHHLPWEIEEFYTEDE